MNFTRHSLLAKSFFTLRNILFNLFEISYIVNLRLQPNLYMENSWIQLARYRSENNFESLK